jgi:four helix bundle protein
MFEFEKLRVYDAAQRLLREITGLMGKVAPGHAYLKRHALESAESVSLNICEACGDDRPAKKANYFRIAAGSASECSGAIKSLVARGALAKRYTYKCIDLCDCLVRMLTGLAEYYEGMAES